jgi:hypothetical protein
MEGTEGKVKAAYAYVVAPAGAISAPPNAARSSRGRGTSARRPKPKDLEEAIDIVTNGRSLRSACRELGLDVSSTSKALNDSGHWGPQYALAREIRGEFYAEQALQLGLAAALGRKIDGHSVDVAGARVALNAIKWHSAHMDPKGEPKRQVENGFDDMDPQERLRRIAELNEELGYGRPRS